MSEAPKIQPIQSVVDITNKILWLNVASPMQSTMHVYEVCSRTVKRGVDLISEVLQFGQLCYGWTKWGQQRCQLRDALQPLT